MLSRWFIGVNAKSKGYFTGWSYYGKNNNIKGSFTKQTALAESFTTEEKAIERIDLYRKETQKELDKVKSSWKSCQDIAPKWTTITDQERVEFYEKMDNNLRKNLRLSWRYASKPVIRTRLSRYSQEAIDQLKDINWINVTVKESATEKIEFFEARLDFINNKLLVREVEIELKFKDNERVRIEWSVRGENDTAYAYCNACGGAIPNIPQLRLGNVIICAICMGKLADEAKIQAGKVDDEIMEHYQTDRFLRELG